MPYEFKLPEMGEGVVEGEVVGWLAQPGDEIAEDQPLVEVMTDKATVAVPSPKAGRLAEVKYATGDMIEVGAVLAIIETGDEEPARPAEPREAEAEIAEGETAAAQQRAEGGAAAVEATTGERPEKAGRRAAAGAREVEDTSSPPPPTGEAKTKTRETPPARIERGLPVRTTTPAPGRRTAAAAGSPQAGTPRPTETAAPRGEAFASPSLRRRARELGVDVDRVPQARPNGRPVSEAPARETRGNGGAAPQPAPTPDTRPAGAPEVHLPPGVEPPPPGGEHRVPLRGMRKIIAEKMQQSKNTAAHFTFVEEVDMRRLIELRTDMKAAAAERGVKLTYMPFFVKAVVQALVRHPQLNVSLDEERQEIVYKGHYDVGIAVATDRGLMVPVVHGADGRSLLGISEEIERLAQDARAGRSSREDLTGSTFTITSLGLQGGLFATPVINYPEVAIMGIHQIKDRAVVENGQIVAGKVMLLSLSFDHRVVDGHVGAAFAYDVIELLEHPERLFMEMV